MTLDYDGWLILIGVLAATACVLPGTWLVVRGMGLMGDAISHAVLPGIVVGFLISASRESVWMFGGAAVAGVLAAVAMQALHRWGRVERGAAMGTVFTIMFALGLLLIVRVADTVHLDADCVLHGAIELAPFDLVTVAGVDLPRVTIPLMIVVLINAAVTVLLWKELRLAAFDPALSKTLGFNADWLSHLVMVMTAATCVAAFEAIGSIITVALIVGPPATALLLSRRLAGVFVIAIGAGAVVATAGHLSAIWGPPLFFGEGVDTSTAGMMAVMAGVVFVLVGLTAPRRGVVARWLASRRLSARVALEDALGLLFRLEEQHGDRTDATVRSLLVSDVRVGAARMARVLSRLISGELARVDEGVWTLTAHGRSEAAGLVRAHRLWETYLAGHAAIPASHLHAAAEQLEHVSDPSMIEALERETGAATRDPHGREIPPSDPR